MTYCRLDHLAPWVGVLVVRVGKLQLTRERIVPILTLRMGSGTQHSTAQGLSSGYWDFHEELRILVHDWRSQWVFVSLYDSSRTFNLKNTIW